MASKRERCVPSICTVGERWIGHQCTDSNVRGWFINRDETELVEVMLVEHNPSWIWDSVCFMEKGGGFVSFGDNEVSDYDVDLLIASDLFLPVLLVGNEMGFYEIDQGGGKGKLDSNAFLRLPKGFFRTRKMEPLAAMQLLVDERAEYVAWLNGLLVFCQVWHLHQTRGGRVEASFQGELDGYYIHGLQEAAVDNATLLAGVGRQVQGFDSYRVVDFDDANVKAFTFYSDE